MIFMRSFSGARKLVCKHFNKGDRWQNMPQQSQGILVKYLLCGVRMDRMLKNYAMSISKVIFCM